MLLGTKLYACSLGAPMMSQHVESNALFDELEHFGCVTQH